MTNLVLLILIGSVAGLVAWLLTRRGAEAPVRTGAPAPGQLDRADFPHPERPWAVIGFTSTTCTTCADVMMKAGVLASDEVTVAEVTYQTDRTLHDRYGIESVPLLLIADRDGVVRHHTWGPVNAAHLWAAMAELREPGSVPPGCG